MFGFTLNGCVDPARDSSLLAMEYSSPISANSFHPPRVFAPRAWQRVAVAPVPGLRRQPKIWKRVGGLAVASGLDSYSRAMAELERQGQGARKRPRHARHVPVLGNARWAPRGEQECNVQLDLEEAQATVSSANEAAAAAAMAIASNNTRTRPSAFPEETLKWVPRKRHNSRWPIEPKGGNVAALPSSDSSVPGSPEHAEVAVKMDEKQMLKRSTRRLSRRISLFPADGSPRKLPMITLSPATSAAPALSPIKRVPVLQPPTKVADSPRRAFSVNATPNKVVLETPRTVPPAPSPAKIASSPTTPAEHVLRTPANKPRSPASAFASPVALLFDQPSPDIPVEPLHETRRRVSLQSARRSDRGSSGVSRLLALKSGRSSPGRRHSFTSMENDSSSLDAPGGKHRRNTMDMFSVGPEGVRKAGGLGMAHRKTEEVVEIDLKSNLDIFGQPTRAATQSLRAFGQHEETTDAPESPATEDSASRDVILTSPPADHVGVTELAGMESGAESESFEQTPTSFDARPSAPEADLDLFDTLASGQHGEQSADRYLPHDPEGLSTIFEESTMVEGHSPEEEAVEQPSPSDAQSSLDEQKLEDRNDNPAGHEREMCADAATAAEPGMGASVPGTPSLADLPAGHVVTGRDAMSASDSLEQTLEEPVSVQEAAIPQMENGLSLSPGIPRTSNSTLVAPGTPTTTAAAIPTARMLTPESSAGAVVTQRESSGFTPINGRQISPPSLPASDLKDDDEAQVDQDLDDDDADEVIEEELLGDDGCEPTVALDDETMTVNPPRPECDTLQLHARHDDSETEMLRKFVTRVTADKNAKAAAAAAALAKKSARRSGSLGLTTSSTGSPMAKPGTETPASRKPLGVRSPNSPSPSKKRKHELVDVSPSKMADPNPPSHPAAPSYPAAPSSTDLASDPDGPRPKRRRKRESPTPRSPSPEPSPARGAGVPRRSTRSRNRVALRPTAPSANSIAFSMIPVRLPGMGALDDAPPSSPYLPSIARQRIEEKDLATVTRANTRKNKAGAVPPQVVLARQAEDAGWRMRELKGVFEAREKKGETGGKGKGVQWDEELVRYQEASVFRGLARDLLADVMMADEIAEAEPPPPPEPVVEKTARVASRRTAVPAAAPASAAAPAPTTRRTRSSRLPPPTPVKKIAAAGEKSVPPASAPVAAPTLKAKARSLPRLVPAPAPAAAQPAEVEPGSTSAKSGMATRRTRVQKLGMSGNGTPAPKRKARTAA
ncbi:hypothetical protein C8A05DRAFT_31789 [Staphylotrichum tortipilum]|uniref:Uncharacterized protein n=1 Tax=Staphylotrichum tortipilum TaxID=2831512 RepID=A0AAN6MNY6_9PEZI|nr:hypothetical protein C8A05DRAFT_31789 [Staphylotrichum longicolle]